MSHKILFSGYYGFDNSGDDAILQAIVSNLRDRDPSLDLSVLSFNPKRTQRNYQIKGVQRFQFSATRQALKETDLLISGGGSLLQDVTSSRSLYYYLSIIAQAKRYKKKVYIYANGVGPINRPFNRWLTRKILNKVDYITLRDQGSLKTLEDIGVQGPPMEVTADPVYSLKKLDQEVIQGILRAEGIPQDGPSIGVALREWKATPSLTTKLAHVLDQVHEALGLPLVFIPLHYPKDLYFSEKVRAKMIHQRAAYVVRGDYSAQEVMGLIGSTDLVLAMRLHGLIYGVTEAVPPVGLVYDPKVSSHLEDLGIGEAVQVEDFNTRALADMLVEVYQDRREKSRRLLSQRDQLKRKNDRNVDHVFELLEGIHEENKNF
ncbi:MAG: polysaccharide pyruvyl transferase CsaB [Tissierellia bacterium]|nr:polysaccharide pyruvyl transferase CsaB [Tissierellia bacterium]